MEHKQKEELFVEYTELYDSLLRAINEAGSSRKKFRSDKLQELSASQFLAMIATKNIRFIYVCDEEDEAEDEENDETPVKKNSEKRKAFEANKKTPITKKNGHNLSAEEKAVLAAFLDAFFDAVEFPEGDDCVVKFYESVFDDPEDAKVLEKLHQDINDTYA